MAAQKLRGSPLEAGKFPGRTPLVLQKRTALCSMHAPDDAKSWIFFEPPCQSSCGQHFFHLKQHVQGKRQNWVKDSQLCFLRCQFWMFRIHQSKKGTNSEIIKLWRNSPINIENCMGKLMVQAEFQTHHFNFWVQAKWFPSVRLLDYFEDSWEQVDLYKHKR